MVAFVVISRHQVHSANAVGSAMKASDGRHFVAVSPDTLNACAGSDAPIAVAVDFAIDSNDGAAYELHDLRAKTKPPVKCASGKCRLTLQLDTTAVFLFAPAALQP